jgi:hypothetical protein
LSDVGPQLRSDDPSALKETILLLQKQAGTPPICDCQLLASRGVSAEATKTEPNNNATAESSFGSRVKFMLQTIYDLKNNKKAGDDTLMQTYKKSVSNFAKKNGNFVTLSILCEKGGSQDNMLKIPFADFLAVETNGSCQNRLLIIRRRAMVADWLIMERKNYRQTGNNRHFFSPIG